MILDKEYSKPSSPLSKPWRLYNMGYKPLKRKFIETLITWLVYT